MNQRAMNMTSQETTGKVIYICAPFSADPVSNTASARTIARRLVLAGHLPVVPHLLLPPILDEETDRDLALQLCLKLVQLVDEVRLYGKLTGGMRLEISAAKQSGIPVRYEASG